MLQHSGKTGSVISQKCRDEVLEPYVRYFTGANTMASRIFWSEPEREFMVSLEKQLRSFLHPRNIKARISGGLEFSLNTIIASNKSRCDMST
ncbi:hypothetical protein NPIL_36461 [Nephila pilipes]|uniref:Uncharacterized protein n=1 Tax=Nephila pilipes TaxID=299642 RepID=A0A8X6UCH7_NEPPI|nr:hypothetical protein NPIL_36461 [Nephila pilipes]